MKSVGLPLLFLLVRCSQAMAEPEPQWLVDARAREGALTDVHVVTSTDQRISFSVPVALAGKLKESKESYEAFLTLGPDAVADCEILNTDVDVAATLRATAILTFSEIEKAQGRIERRNVEHIGADVAGATPFLSVSWVYRVNDAEGAKLGGLRQVAAVRSGHGIYCSLNNLGYEKTFGGVTRALIESLRTKDDAETPYYSEISVATLGTTRIGYSAIALRRDKDGDTKLIDSSAVLLSANSESLQSHDTVYVEWFRPDGALINSLRSKDSNGEIEMDLTLKPGEGEKWLVDGKFKGKDVKEIISGVPSTWLSQTNTLRTLLAKEDPIGAEASQSDWLTMDPGRLTETKIKVLAAVDAKSFSVRETSASTSLELIVDRATGGVTHGVTQLGPTSMTFDRIYVQGSP